MSDGTRESELIDRLRSGSGRSARVEVGIGDDAAVTVPGGATATSVDAVVDGVHFRTELSSPEDVAQKAMATALSDLAAMAAEPGEAYVTLGIPPGTDDGYLEDLADGFMAAADDFGAVLAGGDTVSSPVLFAAVTVVGHAAGASDLILRSGASPGDVVAVTGELGGAAAGLWLLSNEGIAVQGLGSAERDALVGRQLRPAPRLHAGRVLGRLGATAMVDLSDGLATDLAHVAEMSAGAITCDPGLVPVQPGVPEVEAAAGLPSGDLALAGGEDYELALTLPEAEFDAAHEALAALGLGLTAIGLVAEGSGLTFAGDRGQRDAPAGFDHLT